MVTNLDNAVLTKEYRVVYAPPWAMGEEKRYYGTYEDFYHFAQGNTQDYVRTEMREVITITGDWEEYDEGSKT